MSSWSSHGIWKDTASLNVNCGPPFRPTNFWPKAVNSTVSTVPAGSIPKLPDTVSQPLLKLFQKLAGGAPKATMKQALASHAAKTKAKAPTPVKVAVIDATPTKKGLTAPDRTFHGFSVTRTVGHLACDEVDSPACAEQVVAQLALPIVGDVENDATEDFESGGRTGTFQRDRREG